MKVLTFSKRTTLQTAIGAHSSAITINPGVRIVLDDISAQQIIQPKGAQAGATSNFLQNYSDISPFLSKAPPTDWKGKNILFSRKRGIGDELCLTALPRYFSEKLGANCYVLCHASTESIWQYNDTVKSILGEPLYLESIYRRDAKPFFDHSFFFESVTEWDSEPDQANVYDLLFHMAGIDPATVGERYKRPLVRLTAADMNARILWEKETCRVFPDLDFSRGYIVHQLSTTNLARNLPEHKEIEVLRSLEKCGMPVLTVDDKPSSIEILQFIDRSENIFNVSGRIPTLRLYFSVIAAASAVVGPDSSAIHVAAAFNVPSVGLWGPFSADSRAKYYPNHYSIHHTELCSRAPCFNFQPHLPHNLCPKGDAQKYCECFDGIRQDEVSEALQSLKIGVPL